MNKPNVLPDSRSKNPVGAKCLNGAWMIPIYCANCGADGGFVTAEAVNFAFYLCNKCFEAYGEITNMYVMPDEVFWEKLRQEQLESHGHYLTELELAKVVEEDSSPLATLAKQRQ